MGSGLEEEGSEHWMEQWEKDWEKGSRRHPRQEYEEGGGERAGGVGEWCFRSAWTLVLVLGNDQGRCSSGVSC